MIKKIISIIVSFILMLSFSQTICLGSAFLNLSTDGTSLTKNVLSDLASYFYIYGFNSPIKYKGDYHKSDKVDIIISNHINTIDFCIYLSIIREFDSRDIYFIMKKQILFIPGFGSIFTHSKDIKLNKKIEDDGYNIEKTIRNIKDGLIIILPEGTRYTPEKHVIAKQFSKDNNLQVFNNTLYPKMKGIYTICDILKNNNKLGNIIDFTIYIKNLHLKKSHIDTLLMKDIGDTYNIINSYVVPINTLDNYNNFKNWFLDIWTVKEDLLDNMNKNTNMNDFNIITPKLKLYKFIILIVTVIFAIHITIFSNGLFIPISVGVMSIFSFIKYKQLKRY